MLVGIVGCVLGVGVERVECGSYLFININGVWMHACVFGRGCERQCQDERVFPLQCVSVG